MRRFDPQNLTAGQLRAARALLDWTAQDLADATKVGVATIRRAELCEGRITTNQENVKKIMKAFLNAGIVFITSRGGGAGVLLKR